MLKNMIKLKISGKNIDRFINKIYKSKIDIIDLEYINRKEIVLKIYLSDYDSLKKIKSIYDYNLVNIYGKIKIKKIIGINKYLIFFLTLGLLLIYGLSNVIFNVSINTDNELMKELILKEMKNNNIYKYSIKKNYSDLKKIVNRIKEDNMDRIEWIEIKNVGTKYIVNFLERKRNNSKTVDKPRNLVAKKSGILKNIVSNNGVIVKNINDYVNKGDVIVSGEIKNNEEIKSTVSASGSAFAEVWYKVRINYPMVIIENTKTNKTSSKINIKFLSNYLLKSKYNIYKRENINIINNNLLPIGIVKNIDQEVLKKDVIYTPEEATYLALELGNKKINNMLDNQEFIISKKKLNYFIKGSTIELEVFYKVYEDITEYNVIDDVKE